MQDQKSVTLHGRSVFGGGSNIVTSIFGHKGGQYFDYWLMLVHSPLNIQDASPKIVHAPLTLIFSG